jgi:hypothetical protein
VTFNHGVSNHTIRFSAVSLAASSIYNPISSGPSRSTLTVAANANAARNVTPAPATRTIPQRVVYTAIQADVRSLMNGIQTQDQLDELRARIERIR